MDFVSYITLLALLVYIIAVRQSDGHNRHAQRLRTRRDRYQDPYPSSYSPYNYYSSKFREEQLLMEINERLSGIISQLKRKQQQPVYVPIYVPYYMPYFGPNDAQIFTKTKNDENVSVNERNSFKTDPVLDTEDKRIESPQDISNDGEKMDCPIAIVACCRFSEDGQKQNCFRFYKCPQTYYNNEGCAKETIDNAVTSVVNRYRPTKRHA